jgi:two-component system, OmpR family, alkaline phosphatase synthesis response regulator PhoP
VAAPLARILVIEDNEDLAFGLRNNIEIEGYGVEVATDGRSGLNRAREFQPDLIVLDLMFPSLDDGYRVLRELRQDGNTVPVVILTARTEEADKIRGFRLGADDYVTKPFGILELIARVEAIMRRAGGGGRPAHALRFGDVTIDAGTRTVRKSDRVVALTPMEFNLLLALAKRQGAVVSRLDLLREVWGHASTVLTRTVDTHVGELRRKLEDDPSQPRYILTSRKAGYRLEQNPNPSRP